MRMGAEGRKLIFDASKKCGAQFRSGADARILDDGIDAGVATLQLDDAALFGTLRGFFGPLNQAQVEAIQAALRGAPAPAPSPEGITEVGLSAADFAEATRRLGCTLPQIRAVDEVESGSGWFTDVRGDILALDGPGGFIDGPNLPKILFEAHIFARHTAGRFTRTHPNLSSAKWNRALYIGGQGEWGRLHKAMQLDRRAALMSASVGRYQIMGFNHKLAGFATVEAFWDAMLTSEREHLLAFVSFVIGSGLSDELRAISANPETCRPFAKGYNGAGYAQNSYHRKIAAAFKKWAAR